MNLQHPKDLVREVSVPDTHSLHFTSVQVEVLSSSIRLHRIFKFLYIYLLYLMHLLETGPRSIALVGLQLAM